MLRRSQRLANKKRKREGCIPQICGELFKIQNESVLKTPSNVIDWTKWVAASSTKNYVMDDPFLDFLKYSSSSLIRSFPNLASEFTPKQTDGGGFMKNICEAGNVFESKVYDLLKSELGEDNVIDIGGNLNSRSDEKYHNTIKAMKDGIPLIYQGIVRNYTNKTYGVPDLLIRSDYLNSIVDLNAYTGEESKIAAPYLQKKGILSRTRRTRRRRRKINDYHYVVIDIKYKQLVLRSDGIHLRNDGNNKAFKSQVWVYTDALGEMQGYRPKCGFILGSKWKYTSSGEDYSGNSCFERLGRIDYTKLDKEYILKTKSAVEWINHVKEKGKTWNLSKTPLPRAELYPNMCNSYDYPYHKIKKEFADSIGELTLLWYVGPKERRNAHNNKVYSWKNPFCNPSILGMKGEKRPKVLRAILDANRDQGHNIRPKYFGNNYGDWKNRKKLELFVDFEMNNSVFQDFQDLPNFTNKTMIFLIGAGYICPHTNKWIYKKFLVDRLNPKEESRICSEFMTYIEVLKRKYKVDEIPLYHWSHAEVSSWNRAGERYQDECVLFYSDLEWVDLLKTFTQEPVGIKGCLNYGLKTVTKAYSDHGYIKTKYDSNLGCTNGADAAVEAYRIEKACQSRGITFPDHPLTEEIVKYNEIDCKVLQEILEHNRQNHIHPQDEDLFENRDSIESFSEDSLDEEYDRIFKKRKID